MLQNWFDPQLGYISLEIWLLIGMVLVISSIGFYRVVYYISIGYAFSIVAMAIITPFRHLENLTWTLALQDFFLMLWGLGLGIYLIQREYRASYRNELTNIHQRSAGMSRITKLLIRVS